jgi:hypothetical protein
MIIENIIIEKTISNTSKKMLDKYMIETWSSNGHQMNVEIPITKMPLGDWRTNNHLVATKRSNDKQSFGDC